MTKAERYRYEQERTGPKKAPKRLRRGGSNYPGATGAGASLNDERRRQGRTASRNWSIRAGREAPYVLEDSPSGKPSRRSTRKAANHQKPGHPWRSSKVNAILKDRLASAPRRGARAMSPPNA